jgi:ribosomal protein S13
MLFFTDIPIKNEKSMSANLSNIYGISKSRGFRICVKFGQNSKSKLFSINAIRVVQLQESILSIILKKFRFKCDAILKQACRKHLKRLKFSKNYRAKRHALFLPVRGQRTHKNAQTQKQKRGMRKRRPIAKKKK